MLLISVSATTSGASRNPFSKSAETGKSVASTILRECQCLIAREPVISTTKHRGRGCARGGQCLETEASHNTG